MNYFAAYLKLEMKKGMRLIPFFLLSIIITAAAAVSAAVLFSAAAGRRGILPRAEVAIVSGSDGSDDTSNVAGTPDFSTMLMIGAVENMDSVKSICHISYMSPKDALAGLRDGTLSAAAYLPADVYEDINTGVNTPVRVRLSSAEGGLLPGLFRELVESGVSLIRTVETAIYSVDDLSGTYPLSAELPAIEDRIFGAYVSAALSRGDAFSPDGVSAFGSLTVYEFYLVCAAVLILLLFGVGFRSFYTAGEEDTAQTLGRLGLPRPAVSAAKIISMTCVLTVLIAAVVIAMRLTARFLLPGLFPAFALPLFSGGISPAGILSVPATAFSAAAFIHLVYSFAPEKNSSIFYLLIAAALFITCGGLVPASFLPAFLRLPAAHSPVSVWQAGISAILRGAGAATGGAPPVLFPALAAGCVMLIPPCAKDVLRNRIFRPSGADLIGPGQGVSSAKPVSAGISAGFGMPSGNVLTRTSLRYRLLLVSELRRPSCLALTAAGASLLLILASIPLPSSGTRMIGLAVGDGTFAKEVSAKLLENDGTFEYVLYPDREALEAAVESSRADSGFVLDRRIDTAVLENDWKAASDSGMSVPDLTGCIDYVYTTSTTKGEAAKEDVFSCLFDTLSVGIMERAVDNGAVFSSPDAEVREAVAAGMREISGSGSTFRILFEYVTADGEILDGSAGSPAAAGSGNSSAGALPLAGLLIFAAALLFSQARKNPEHESLSAYLRSDGFLFRIVSVLAPLTVFTAGVFAAAAVSGMRVRPSALLLIPFTCVCAVWASLFSRPFRNRELCLFTAVGVIIFAAVLNPKLPLGGAMVPAAFRALRVLLPGAWL